jgi:indolepyruvate ferredoxin oxidoreductase
MRESFSLLDADLDSKYTLRQGRVYLSGVQALVRLPIMQRQQDVAAGLNTAGFISGYRGSPLGTFDQQLWKANRHLAEHHIHFEPGLNEELAATAVWGSQQTGLFPGAKYDGVFAMWYGKAPGVDRAGDGLRHGSSAGAAPLGGVLVLLGDDHNCKSASLPSQSEYACMHAMIPVLNPAGVEELLDYGLLGWALSRYSGAWVGLKCLIDTLDASASIEVSEHRARPVVPGGLSIPSLNIRWPDPPLQQELRQHGDRMSAIETFARANGLDRAVIDPGDRKRLALITTGKSYQDVCLALDELGISAERAADLGIGLYKVGMSWPLEPQRMRAFARGFELVMVVEEKRGLIEEQLARMLYDLPGEDRPRVIGKRDESGAPLFPSAGELNAVGIARVLATHILRIQPSQQLARKVADLEKRVAPGTDVLPRRLPYFCPGCPHNTSTKVPDGSRALAGIGCHYMAQWMDRSTETFTQMGAEGTSWIGQAPFSSTQHVFANLGDGTFAHSGSLAIRAAVAAKVNITYKLLYNDAVAMTGGQAVEAHLSVPQIVQILRAEGIAKIRIVTDDPNRYLHVALPADVSVTARDTLDAAQRELRDVRGVTVLIYDQTCAAELRRRRKRKLLPEPPHHVFINEYVCEGCGDCGLQSNCVAVVPLATELGRKRQIDQSACNKDRACVAGFCPSFVSVIGGRALAATRSHRDTLPPVPPAPNIPDLGQPYGIVIAGVGGTGVVTVGALIGMAAHLERKGVNVLDMVGLAQKGGQVISQIWIAAAPHQICGTRIPSGRGSLLLGCDLMVSACADSLSLLDRLEAYAIVNDHPSMPTEFTRNADLELPVEQLREAIAARVAGDRVDFLDSTARCAELFGDTISANIFLLGYAWQKGLIPLREEALLRAIEIDGSAVQINKAAFLWGRHAAARNAATSRRATAPPKGVDASELIARRTELLTSYQNAAYAQRYKELASRVRVAEERQVMGRQDLTVAVAENLHRLMAYKDEYEVARLFTATDFLGRLRKMFAGSGKLRFHMAPPLLAKRDGSGRPVKREFGAWIIPILRALAAMRRLRGTRLDVFGYTTERVMERRLITQYTALIEEILLTLQPRNHGIAVQLARIPEAIRGFGHVKQAAHDAAKRREAELLAQYRSVRA